jgi:hypothetical protein
MKGLIPGIIVERTSGSLSTASFYLLLARCTRVLIVYHGTSTINFNFVLCTTYQAYRGNWLQYRFDRFLGFLVYESWPTVELRLVEPRGRLTDVVGDGSN